MEVILLERVTKLGDLGDQVRVKSGYARNYLLPQKKAVMATKANLANFETRRLELQTKADVKLRTALERADKINELDITLTAVAGEEGKMFGSIGTRDISEAAARAGVEVSKSEIRMPNGAIRELGEYDVVVQLHSEVNATIKIGVVAE